MFHYYLTEFIPHGQNLASNRKSKTPPQYSSYHIRMCQSCWWEKTISTLNTQRPFRSRVTLLLVFVILSIILSKNSFRWFLCCVFVGLMHPNSTILTGHRSSTSSGKIFYCIDKLWSWNRLRCVKLCRGGMKQEVPVHTLTKPISPNPS